MPDLSRRSFLRGSTALVAAAAVAPALKLLPAATLPADLSPFTVESVEINIDMLYPRAVYGALKITRGSVHAAYARAFLDADNLGTGAVLFSSEHPTA